MEAARTEQRRLGWLAWQTARLSRQERMPSLAKFLRDGGLDDQPEPGPQTPDQIRLSMAKWRFAMAASSNQGSS